MADGRSYSVPIELKSTTSRAVSTGRDIGPAHIKRWRLKVWIFGFYDRTGTNLNSLLTLSPEDMEPWIGRIEGYIAPDFLIGERLAQRLSLEDLQVICGEKDIYSREDAKALLKRQWSNDEYASKMDVPDGYSPSRMLELLRLRAQYLNARGATLNNPHIPKTFFSNFPDREMHLGSKPLEFRPTLQAAIQAMTLANQTLRRVARER